MERLILGIDPGTAILGYGLVVQNGHKYSAVDHGCIRTSSKLLPEERLILLYNGITKVIAKHQPDEIAVEELFFSKNVKTAMSVAQARGVVLLSAAQAGIKTAEYKPNQIKLAVCGYGGADKRQVQEMVKRLLNMSEIVKPDDAADALAIAICHLNSRRVLSLKDKNRSVTC